MRYSSSATPRAPGEVGGEEFLLGADCSFAIDHYGGFDGEDHIDRIGNILYPIIPVGILHNNLVYPRTWKGVLSDIYISLVEVW